MTGGGIAALIAVLFVVSRLGGDGAHSSRSSTAQAVSVVPVEVRTFASEVSLNGEARPVRDIQVTAQASGVRILQILVDEGDFVAPGPSDGAAR
jgi:multidrug efflux pump subunit AcrA (membrane-fusion protein)